jgi:hypothetical protein
MDPGLTKYHITFIHFTKNTIKRIEDGGDVLLEPYYEDYKLLLKSSADQINLKLCQKLPSA